MTEKTAQGTLFQRPGHNPKVTQGTAKIRAILWLPGAVLELEEVTYDTHFWPELKEVTTPTAVDSVTGQPTQWVVDQPLIKMELKRAGVLERVEYRLTWSGILEQDYNRERLGQSLMEDLQFSGYEWMSAYTVWRVVGECLASFQRLERIQACGYTQ